VRTLIASVACAAALLVAAVPAGAAPVDGRGHGPFPPVEQTSQPVIHELHTVVRERDAGRTLAFVLAGAAIVIAAASAVYSRHAVARLS
jgi:hypothetical protein